VLTVPARLTSERSNRPLNGEPGEAALLWRLGIEPPPGGPEV